MSPPDPSISGSLDTRFGALRDPAKVGRLESSRPPQSIQKLTPVSGQWLKELMELTAAGFTVPGFIHSRYGLLWVIDALGDLWFALEEVVDLANDQHAFALPHDARVAEGFEKLGHPSLIRAAAGRIAGEILFDVISDPPKWVMTNYSGRYGRREYGRTAHHLDQAAALIQVYFPDLETIYI